MRNGQTDFDDQDLEAPLPLVSALKGLPTETIFIPGALDNAVLAQAREHLRRDPVRTFRWLDLRPWAAGALATLLILFLIARHSVTNRHPSKAPQHLLAREDLNSDGRVDILDAFILAKTLQSGGRPERHLDVNQDGVIDERDVTAIAVQAVKLDKGGRS